MESKRSERIGEKHLTNRGYQNETIKYDISSDCDIKFEDGLMLENREYAQIKKSLLHKPQYVIGEEVFCKNGSTLKLLEYINSVNCTIQFETGHIKRNVPFYSFKKGLVKNPYKPSLYGIGYLGENFKATKNMYKKFYNTWKTMLYRSYNEKYKTRNKTYKDVTVCEDWKCFFMFATWMNDNFNFETMEGWQLDKDILVKGNKIYSPETCCFVPAEINMFFTRERLSKSSIRKVGSRYHLNLAENGKNNYKGSFLTYDLAKEAYFYHLAKYALNTANKWEGIIDDRVHDIILNYAKNIKKCN